MRLVSSATFVVAFALTLAQADAAPQPGTVQWVKPPSATLDPLNWPERALRLKVDGEAVLSCGYDAQGVLHNCIVLSESPASFGFGSASLRMAPRFRLLPTLSDGSPLLPGEVSFPVKFIISDFKDPRSLRY